jgi:hypothetical protein
MAESQWKRRAFLEASSIAASGLIAAGGGAGPMTPTTVAVAGPIHRGPVPSGRPNSRLSRHPALPSC